MVADKYISKFWSLVDKQDGACWLWTGYITEKGYGRHEFGGTKWRVHRLSYELVNGAVPKGLVLDHLCRVRNCVNPEHLEAVTHKENTLRGNGISAINSRATSCPRGHAYDEANTYICPRGRRECRACRKDSSLRWRNRARES